MITTNYIIRFNKWLKKKMLDVGLIKKVQRAWIISRRRMTLRIISLKILGYKIKFRLSKVNMDKNRKRINSFKKNKDCIEGC